MNIHLKIETLVEVGFQEQISSTNSNSSSTLMKLQRHTVGRKVKHNKFGEGTIVAVADVNGDKKLTIAFNKQGIKELNVSQWQNLELIIIDIWKGRF